MNKYIYKIRNKIVSGDEENPIITYEDIEPKLLACVPVVIQKPYKVINEDGTEGIITPKLEIHKFYPLWKDDIMVYIDKEIKKEEPMIVEPEPIVPYVPTDEENLETLKQAIIRVSTELFKLEISGFDADELHVEKEELIAEHKVLAKKISEN